MNLKLLFLSTMIISFSCALNVLDYNSEYDLIEDLKDNDGKIFLLFIYASTNLHPLGYEQFHQHYHSEVELGARNRKAHDELLSWAETERDLYY